MTDSVFLDTNGWLALLHSGDSMHAQANRLWREMILSGANVVLTDWVIAETGNGSSRSPTRHRFVDAVRATVRDPRVELINVDDELLNRSLDLYAQHADKSWGLVDCASFLVMHDRGISIAFTSDQHFEQAGYTRLLTT